MNKRHGMINLLSYFFQIVQLKGQQCFTEVSINHVGNRGKDRSIAEVHVATERGVMLAHCVLQSREELAIFFRLKRLEQPDAADVGDVDDGFSLRREDDLVEGDHDLGEMKVREDWQRVGLGGRRSGLVFVDLLRQLLRNPEHEHVAKLVCAHDRGIVQRKHGREIPRREIRGEQDELVEQLVVQHEADGVRHVADKYPAADALQKPHDGVEPHRAARLPHQLRGAHRVQEQRVLHGHQQPQRAAFGRREKGADGAWQATHGGAVEQRGSASARVVRIGVEEAAGGLWGRALEGEVGGGGDDKVLVLLPPGHGSDGLVGGQGE